MSADGGELWLGAAIEAMSEVAATVLSCDTFQVGCRRPTLPQGLVGAVISLLADQSLQVGLFAALGTCQAWTRVLLGMTEGEVITEEDVTDATGELVNILAGACKRRMVKLVDNVQLGLPSFHRGDLVAGPTARVSLAELRIGSQLAELFVLSHCNTM